MCIRDSGTIASAGLAKVREIMQARFDPATCNVYLLYASDGDNAADDRAAAGQELEGIAAVARYAGYVEVAASPRSTQSETTQLFQAAADAGKPCGRYSISAPEEVAAAVRHFFTTDSQAAESQPAPQAAPEAGVP